MKGKFNYKAFISYSHQEDSMVAKEIQKFLENFGKGIFQIRNFNIFRDETNLNANPELWTNIKHGLVNSEYLIILLNETSINSRWVNMELDYWIEFKDIGKLIIIWTDTKIEGENIITKFPINLKNTITDDPYYVDLSRIKRENKIDLKNLDFKNKIIKVLATFKNKEPKDLFDEEYNIAKKAKNIKIASFVIIFFMIILSIALYYRTEYLNKQSRYHEVLALARDSSPTEAVKYFMEAYKIFPNGIINNDVSQLFYSNYIGRQAKSLIESNSLQQLENDFSSIMPLSPADAGDVPVKIIFGTGNIINLSEVLEKEYYANDEIPLVHDIDIIDDYNFAFITSKGEVIQVINNIPFNITVSSQIENSEGYIKHPGSDLLKTDLENFVTEESNQIDDDFEYRSIEGSKSANTDDNYPPKNIKGSRIPKPIKVPLFITSQFNGGVELNSESKNLTYFVDDKLFFKSRNSESKLICQIEDINEVISIDFLESIFVISDNYLMLTEFNFLGQEVNSIKLPNVGLKGLNYLEDLKLFWLWFEDGRIEKRSIDDLFNLNYDSQDLSFKLDETISNIRFTLDNKYYFYELNEVMYVYNINNKLVLKHSNLHFYNHQSISFYSQDRGIEYLPDDELYEKVLYDSLGFLVLPNYKINIGDLLVNEFLLLSPIESEVDAIFAPYNPDLYTKRSLFDMEFRYSWSDGRDVPGTHFRILDKNNNVIKESAQHGSGGDVFVSKYYVITVSIEEGIVIYDYNDEIVLTFPLPKGDILSYNIVKVNYNDSKILTILTDESLTLFNGEIIIYKMRNFHEFSNFYWINNEDLLLISEDDIFLIDETDYMKYHSKYFLDL